MNNHIITRDKLIDIIKKDDLSKYLLEKTMTGVYTKDYEHRIFEIHNGIYVFNPDKDAYSIPLAKDMFTYLTKRRPIIIDTNKQVYIGEPITFALNDDYVANKLTFLRVYKYLNGADYNDSGITVEGRSVFDRRSNNSVEKSTLLVRRMSLPLHKIYCPTSQAGLSFIRFLTGREFSCKLGVWHLGNIAVKFPLYYHARMDMIFTQFKDNINDL